MTGCDRLSSVIGCGFGQGLTQALSEFSSFCLTGLCRYSNMSLLFNYSFPDSLLRSVTLSSNFISVLGVHCPCFKVLLFAAQIMKAEAGGGG